MSTPASPPAGPPTIGGLPRKNLIIIGVVAAAIWAFAIQTGSTIFMIIVGVLTLIVLAGLIWLLRMARKQMGLSNMLQNATTSAEARREALAKLDADPKAKEPINVFARAQLLAADDPGAAIDLLEPIEIKRFPPQMQDDVCVLRSQLYLSQGRVRDARPLVDLVNVDSPARKDARPLYVSIVAEVWARTGKHTEALALLDATDVAGEANADIKAQLLVARTFAHFAAGKKGSVRDDLKALSEINVQHLGRFVMPQYKVHPELQKLARQIAEKHPDMRRMAQQQQPRGQRGMRPR